MELSAALVAPLVTVAQPKHRVAIKLEEVRGSAEHIVRVRAEIKNISEEPIDVMRASPSRDFTVTVVGPDKKPAALTLAAERSHSVVPNGSQILITLPPQHSISYEWNLSDDVDFSQHGTYRVLIKKHSCFRVFLDERIGPVDAEGFVCYCSQPGTLNPSASFYFIGGCSWLLG